MTPAEILAGLKWIKDILSSLLKLKKDVSRNQKKAEKHLIWRELNKMLKDNKVANEDEIYNNLPPGACSKKELDDLLYEFVKEKTLKYDPHIGYMLKGKN